MKISKIINKLIKLFFLLLLAIPAVPLIFWGILQLPDVQEYGMKKAMAWIYKETGSNITYTSARFTGVNKISFEDLLVLHPGGDTIVYAKDASAAIAALYKFFLKDDPELAVIRKLEFDHSNFNLAIDSLGDLNIQFFIDYLEAGIDTNDTTHSGKPFRIKGIQITNSRFTLKDERGNISTKGVNVGDMDLKNLNIDVKDMWIKRDTIHMDVKLLSFIEKSGFEVKEMKAVFDLCNKHLFFDKVYINTPLSTIDAEKIHMSFNKFKEYGLETLYDKIKFEFEINKSIVNISDIGYFVDFFHEDYQSVTFSGRFNGPLANFKGEDFTIGWGESSVLNGKFDLDGLPKVKEMFLVFDFKSLKTNMQDISSFNLPAGYKIKIPEQLQKLTQINYKGNFTGYINDFVSKGHLSSNLGDISTDIMIVPDSLDQVSFSGKLASKDFKIGAILGYDSLMGNLDANADVKGVYSKKKPLKATLSGFVSKFTINNYTYQKININGAISNHKLVTKFDVTDPNLNMDFEGLFNLSDDIRLYNFKANVNDANLYALHFSKSDAEYHASFMAESNLRGNSLDSLNGTFKLINSFFFKSDKQIQVYNLDLELKNNQEKNEISLQSDILDAHFLGKFKISELKDCFVNYFSSYFPALTINMQKPVLENIFTDFNFKLDFKSTQSFFDFFLPDYFISDSTRITGTFKTGNRNFLKADIYAPEFIFRKNSIKGLVVNISTEDSVLLVNIGSQNLNLNRRFNMNNYTLQTTVSKNAIEFKTRWLNWDTLLYKGNISGGLLFGNEGNSKTYKFSINPSELIVNDTLWKMSACQVIIDSGKVGISNVSIKHGDEELLANGNLSDNPNDSLHFNFINFDLANLNYFTMRQDIVLKGNLHGGGYLIGMKNPLFFTSLEVDNLFVNDVELGFCYLKNIWDNEKQSLNIDGTAKRGDLTVFSITGDYFPSLNGKLDFQLSLNKLKTDFFNPFIKGIFSDIRGLVSGDLQLTGISGKPSLSGKLKLQKNAFTVDFLKTRYNFSTDLEIVANNFILDKIEVFDQFGNTAIVNGIIRTEFLRELNLNLNIKANNFLCLNTKETDNTLYYGTAFSTGTVRIKGKPSDLNFDIDAKTESGTHFNIPLSENADVSSFDYVAFIRNDTSESTLIKAEDKYKPAISGIQMNFNLEVTPEAEVQIIFDSKLGDIIKARGSGNMQMSINTIGTFDLVGEYIIEKGDYLFTLQNFINKKFDIAQGSTIRWSGDPLNAQVDIEATYRKKVSLKPLFPGEPEMEGNATVDCQIFLTGNLMKPTVKYDIFLPFAQEDVRDKVKRKLSSEDVRTKQILYILFTNQFYNENSGENQGNTMAGAGASASAGEFLSNQLSNMLSQLSNSVDIGFNYRPGTEISSSEVEIALSKQLFNDRLSLNGSVGSIDTKSNAAQGSANKVVGDFDVDYKLNKSGNLRARAYNRPNDDQFQTTLTYTQGVGIFYMEEFSSFRELMSKYWAIITGKKKKQQKESDIDKN
jgi:hypothetical protein